MSSLFKYDGKFGKLMTYIFDFIILNAVFILMCLPIITIGANLTAMYAVFIQMINQNERPVLSLYIDYFKKNIKQATQIWLIILGIFLALGIDIYLLSQLDGIGKITIVATFLFLSITVIYTLYLFPLIYKFENSLWQHSKNVVPLALTYLPWTLLLLLVSFGPLVVVYQWLDGAYALLIYYYLFIGCSATLFMNALIFNKVFKQLLMFKNDTQVNL